MIIGAAAIFMAVLCIGLLMTSGQGRTKTGIRLDSLLKEMEHAHLDGGKSLKRPSSLPQMLAATKYNVRKKAEKELLRILRVAMVCSLGLFLYVTVVINNPPQVLKTLSFAMIALSVFPVVLLRKIREKRKFNIERSLVNVMDLIVIGLEAGMTLAAVVREIVQLEPNQKDPLKIELDQMLAEMDAGLDLNKALRALAVRSEIEDLRILASAVVQADRVGSGLAQTFRIYGDDLRSSRRERFRAKIQKLPVTMLLPMVAFQLLPLMILILAPAAIKISTEM